MAPQQGRLGMGGAWCLTLRMSSDRKLRLYFTEGGCFTHTGCLTVCDEEHKVKGQNEGPQQGYVGLDRDDPREQWSSLRPP